MKKVRWKFAAVAASLLIGGALSGCMTPPATAPFTSPQQPTTEATMPSTHERVSPLPTPRATATRRDSSRLEDAARQDLAQHLGIAVDQIEVVSIEKTEMPLGSLGCGETGGHQNQGLTIGDEIVLRVGNQEYTYHSGGGKMVLCTPFSAASEQTPPSKAATPITQPTVRDMAVADLAKLLGIAPAAITVRDVTEAEWPDASLGCPEPGMMYAQVITRGQIIVLEADGRTYEYHAGRNYVIFCRP